VVVSQNPDDGWASGPAVLEKQGADRLLNRTRRSVDVTKLPAAVARLAGMSIRLLNAGGERCQAKLGAFLMRGRAIAGGYETGDGNDDEAWQASAHLLVAKVDGDRPACAGATWARAAELPVPLVTPAEAPSKELRKVALAAFGGLPQSANIQKDFDDWYHRERADAPKPPRWFAYEKPGPRVRVLRSGSKGPTFVSVSERINEGGCEDGVSGAVWALWELQGDAAHPQLVLRNAPDEGMVLVPTATADLNGDGHVELLFDNSSDYNAQNATGQPDFIERGIVRLLDGLYLDVAGPTTPILICPC
jgi:hypothetical protein